MGNPAEYRRSNPDYDFYLTHEDTETRLLKLEERISQLEKIVNTILIPLQGNPKQAKSEKPAKPKLSEKEIEAQKIAQQNNQAALDRLIALMKDGTPRTTAEIIEELEISKGMFRRIRKMCKELEDDGNQDKENRLYFMK